MPWDPTQYLRFADHRQRPALELLARIEHPDAGLVLDLGCGTGTVTALMSKRWPGTEIVGVDSSPKMLEVARRDHPDVAWLEADIASWDPDRPVDVIYSNAALHWLDDHDALFPRIAGWLAPYGVLAVQMPHNHRAPSHELATAVALDGPWRHTLEPLLRRYPVHEPAAYYDILAPDLVDLDVWETEYQQVMKGVDPVAEWTKGSLLRPLLAALDDDSAAAFYEQYAAALRDAYPRRPNGTTLFPFKRLFILGRKPAVG